MHIALDSYLLQCPGDIEYIELGQILKKLSSNMIYAWYRLTRIIYDGYFLIFNISSL